MVDARQINEERFRKLRECLPGLLFDPQRDTAARDCPGFSDYLTFYQLDFPTDMPKIFHAMGTVKSGPYNISCHYWLPNKSTVDDCRGTVMVFHGYFDHVGLYVHLIRYLLNKKYAVVAFDLPGHGLSDGERACIESFDHYVDVLDVITAKVYASMPGPLSAIGQSTGGAILLKRLLEEGGAEFDRITLLAPLIEPAKWWLNRLVFSLTHRLRSQIPRKFLSNSSDRAFLDFLSKKDPLQSLYIPIDWLGAMKNWVDECRKATPSQYAITILQGDQDKTLSWRFNLKLLRKKFPNGEIKIILGARHHMVNEAKVLREQIFSAMGFD